jgi:hypothetical protein
MSYQEFMSMPPLRVTGLSGAVSNFTLHKLSGTNRQLGSRKISAKPYALSPSPCSQISEYLGFYFLGVNVIDLSFWLCSILKRG